MSDAARCPRCFGGLDGPSAVERASIWSCKTCGGILVDAITSGAHAALFERSHELGAGAARKVAGSRPAGPCPICREFMTPTPVRAADVTIDVCGHHGAWYDKGELERAIRGLAEEAAAHVAAAKTSKASGAPAPASDPPLLETGSYRTAPKRPETVEASKQADDLPLLRGANNSLEDWPVLEAVVDLLEIANSIVGDGHPVLPVRLRR